MSSHPASGRKARAAALLALALLAPLAATSASAPAATLASDEPAPPAPLTPDQEAQAEAAKVYIESQGLGARLRWPASAAAALASSGGLNESYIWERQRGKWFSPPSPAQMEAQGRGVLEPAAAAAVKAVVTGFGWSGRNVGFVKADRTRFHINGRTWMAAGTNAYYLARTDYLTEDEVVRQVAAHARQGANLLRVFFAFDFEGAGTQPSLGNFNEAALRRVDHVLTTCAAYGVRVVAVLGNYWPFVGGMQAYVDNWARSVGQPTGQPLEKFYTEPGVRAAFRRSVEVIVGRRNALTGQMYRDDPTIAVWELANEPHTTDRYEANLGIRPGSILCAWVRDFARVVKGIAPNQMVASGEEGYRTDKPGGPHSWLGDGWKGSDFVCNTCNTDVDVATVHVYPDSWSMPDYTWLGSNYIQDRANAAASCRNGPKPVLFEEYGMGAYKGYQSSREPLFRYLTGAANTAGYDGQLTWAVAHPTQNGQLLGSNDDGGYVFDYNGDGSAAVKATYARAAQANRAAGLPATGKAGVVPLVGDAMAAEAASAAAAGAVAAAEAPAAGGQALAESMGAAAVAVAAPAAAP